MPTTPAYCLHRACDQAFLTVRRDGKRVAVYLGNYGTPQSLDRYEATLREVGYGEVAVAAAVEDARGKIARGGGPLPAEKEPVTVLHLYNAFLRHADGYYRLPDGSRSREVDNFRYSFRDAIDAIGSRRVDTLTKRDLVTVRDRMVARGLSRKVVNQSVGRIVAVFLWGNDDEQSLVSDSVAAAFKLVRPLKAFRTTAPELPAVTAAPAADVEAVITAASPVIAAMLRLQLLTGMRPGEVRGLRKRMVQSQDGIFVADFGNEHKMAYKRRPRVVPLGPEAVVLLQPWLDRTHADTDFVFRPESAPRGRGRIRLQQYTRSTYAQAVRRLCDRLKLPRWHPHQIRHLAATEIRREFGLDAVQAVLGHGSRATSEIYAPTVSELAVTVAAKRG